MNEPGNDFKYEKRKEFRKIRASVDPKEEIESMSQVDDETLSQARWAQ